MPHFGLELNMKDAARGLLLLFFLYRSCVLLHRLFLSRLAKFPGPRLAAASSWYEAFFDLRSANFPDVLQSLHSRYGPIVRVNPWELSILDPDFYDSVYVSAAKRRTTLIAGARAGLGMSGRPRILVRPKGTGTTDEPDAISTTSSHEVHRMRRKAVEGFFSKQSVIRMESRIHDEVSSLEDKLRSLDATGTVVRLDHAFTCVTGDLAGLFAAGENPRLLEAPDFNPEWHDSVMGILSVVPYVRNFPWINSVLGVIPLWLLQKLNPRAAGFRAFHLVRLPFRLLCVRRLTCISGTQLCGRRVAEVKADIASKSELKESDKTSIFHHILQSDVPESEKAPDRMRREAFALLAAGTITTASTVSLITFYVLADPAVEKRLRQELHFVADALPEKLPRWTDLEKLPYLTACIKEGLRLSRFFRRSPRISPDHEIQYKQWTIPKNTPVGMSICHMLMDPDVYPDPHEFKPERWIGDVDARVHRNFVPFVRGSRNCLGLNLAWAEMYIILGVLFRPGGHKMSLDCDESDMVLVHDSDVGIPKTGSRGLRVRFE
ncbi:hypothetical protein CDD83_8173 [Cordyceps sp. RAO-2017]|nr:hypothetical protein CDD83_8173 [Cordyceps sp. RAO-2017]